MRKRSIFYNALLLTGVNLLLRGVSMVFQVYLSRRIGAAGRIFSALAHANVNVKMIDQGSSELNIIIGVQDKDFETAIKAIYDIFVTIRL